MRCQHAHVAGGALCIHQIQVIGRVVLALAAVAGDGGGHALAQHGELDGLFLVAVDAAVGKHGVFVHVYINKAGADHFSGGVDDQIGIAVFRIDGGHLSFFKKDVVKAVNGIGGVDQPAAADQSFHIFT